MSNESIESSAVDKIQSSAERVKKELKKVIIGQDDVINQVLIAIFTRNHALLVGVPGLAKTLLISSLAESLDLGYKRISHIMTEKGYRSVRTNSILTNNFIYSIYKKGKVREKRINRDFKTVVKDIMIYETR